MPRRRKPSSSAFDFTGEEALAVERAFKQRNPVSLRRPKISVTSISPLSTITKVLHSRNNHLSSDHTPTSSLPRNTQTPTKRIPVVRKPTTQPPKQPRHKEPRRKHPRLTRKPLSPSSDPSSVSTPTRRSLRRRLPSFKLRRTHHHQNSPRSSDSVPVRLRIRTSPKPNTTTPQPLLQTDDISTDVPLGQSQKEPMKRPRDPSPDADPAGNTALPHVKKPRSGGDADAESNHIEVTRATDPHAGTTADGSDVAHVKHPSGHEIGIEKENRDHTPEFVKTIDEANVASVHDDGVNLESGVESKPKPAMDTVQKDCVLENKDGDDVERSKEDVPNEDSAITEEKPSADVTKPETCVEEKPVAEDVPPTSTAEDKPSPKPSSTDDASASPGRNGSEADSAAAILESIDCATPESTDLFESPVTPLKPDEDVHMSDKSPEVLPANQRITEKQEEDTSANSNGKEDRLSLLPVSTETTPEKMSAAPTDLNRETSEQELQRDQEIVPAGPVTQPVEEPTMSAETDAKENAESKSDAPLNSDPKLESHQATPGPVPTDEIKEESDGKQLGADVVCRKKSTLPMLSSKAERKSPTKAPSGVMKRVRFAEPPPYRPSEKKLGFSGIVKLRRRKVRKPRALDADFGDVSVAAAGTTGPDEKRRHALLDELQYLLDGILGKKGQTPDDQVVASSLQSLVKLLLRKSKNIGERSEEGHEDDSVLVQILVEQPKLLKTIVISLCGVLGKSRASEALLALVLVIILRATPKILLLTENELDLLLNAFFRSSAASLKNSDPDAQQRSDAKDTTEKEPQARRRGKLGRVFDQKKPKEDILASLVKLMTDADVIEEGCSAFKRETDAASHLMGIAISLILRNELETRVWMRDNRRLDKVVAVLYSCEKMMNLQPTKEDDQDPQSLNDIEGGASWIIMEASLRVLEFAVLDQVCQQRLASESRVSTIIISLLKRIKTIKIGPLESEWMICAALRLCINLCHGCDTASQQLVGGNGHNVVLNWLVKECLAAGLLQEDVKQEGDEEVEESFDVRVLCLAVLASTVNQEVIVCNSFHEMQAEGMETRERGAISIILEILRNAELEAKKEESKESSDEDDEGIRRRRRTTKEEDAEREKRAQFVMERKITIGYVCLLVGALACDSKSNRKLIQDVLPGKSFIGVAAVLAEFLEFHHEVGVISGSMNRMYAEIIKKIVEPEAESEKEDGVLETDLDDIGEDLKVDGELDGHDLDLLLDEPDEGDGDAGVVDDIQLGDELVVGQSENSLTTPVDGL